MPYAAQAASNPYLAGLQFAIDNRDVIGRGIKKLAPKRKRYSKAKKAMKRQNRVESATQSGVQHHAYAFGSASSNNVLDRKTLNAIALRMVRPPDANDSLGAAPGMIYTLSGFKLCATFRNTGPVPIHVHMCIVQPTQEDATITDIRSNMLKDPSSLNSKKQDYVDAITVASWDRDQDCATLNPRKFNIYTHQKFVLGPSDDTGRTDRNNSGDNYVHMEKYFPVNKKFEFENTTSTDVEKPFWCLVYYETLFPTSATGLNYLSHNVSHLAYVRNGNK